MEVIDARSALLSNFEVLSLLRELENEHIARTKTALRIKREEEASGTTSKRPTDAVTSENLRTIQVEAIQYLSADHQATRSQTAEGVRRLCRNLRQYDLTKAEKLQVVNLAPTKPVELYVIVEELEDRLGDTMTNVLEIVQSSLAGPLSDPKPFDYTTLEARTATVESKTSFTHPDPDLDADGDAEMDAVNEIVFDDTGEGAGIEGDLEMVDDD
ncbi:hypothetical protein E1B28_009861 [Marasmius oreades]|uniref:DNA-directed RNA polymerase III subunit RPC9 n=1 Tax=Marasmius oreades TaxID=181124 RepID=A0A9P7RVX4_9AGAR|nr:uncharacterized protein E1B28_009861 [Marasmius oreades]KAG7090776.1 hypothetical protein E1B28_009861 [Marasmius oreades]